MFSGADHDWAQAVKFARKGLKKAPLLQALFPMLLFFTLILASVWLFPNRMLPRAVMVVPLSFNFFVLPYFRKPRRHVNMPKLAGPRDGDAERAGETLPHYNYRCTELATAPPLDGLPPNATLADLFATTASVHANRPCLGTREVKEAYMDTSGSRPQAKLDLGAYQFQTYTEVAARVQHVGAGLVRLGLPPKSTVAIYANTSAEWMISAQASFSFGFPVVTAYAALGQEALAHALNEAEVAVTFVDASLLKSLAAVRDKLPNMRTVVYFNDRMPCSDRDDHIAKLTARSAANGGPVDCFDLAQLESLGSTTDVDVAQFKPGLDDLAVVMYTSGSTGLPKGVMLSHRNLMGGIGGLSYGVAGLDKNDVYLAYLPLAHVLEMAAECCILAAGGALGYGSPLTLTANSRGVAPNRGVTGDAAELRPTLMAAVPAVMDLIRDGVVNKVAKSGVVVKTLFNTAYFFKSLAFKAGLSSPFWDRLVFDPLRTRLLGGRVRLMLSGGGPLSGETQRFMNIAFCCPVGQGYGLTETCGGGTIVWADDMHIGRVGVPVASLAIKLKDWEEGGYTHRDSPNPRGEVCMAGANVALGYFKQREKTEEVFIPAEDGTVWFHTGDIGEFCEDGSLRIIDRKKDLVKLSRGEYVSLGKVESAMVNAAEIERICVYANPFHSFPVAVVVPDVKELAHKLGRDIPMETANDDEEVRKMLVDAMKRVGKVTGLQSFEVPRNVVVADEPWTPENEMVTAALKLKRHNINKKYKDALEALYK